MPLTSPVNSPPSSGANFRRFLTRAEAMTLLGMIVCIASLFLAWPPPIIGVPPLSELYRDMASRHSIQGLSISKVSWPIKICAIASGATLMFSTNDRTRLPLAVFQGLCGLVCFVISLTHFALLPGVLTALLGGALLTFGAIDRFMQPQKS